MFTNNAFTIQDDTQLIVDENGNLKAVKTTVQEELVTTEMLYVKLQQLENHRKNLLDEVERVDAEAIKYEKLLSDILAAKKK